jgi:hypothetical protein
MYTFGLKIDNQARSLTAQNGVLVHQLILLLHKLNVAMQLDSPNYVLTEIKTGSYNPIFQTPEKTICNRYQALHEKIETEPYDLLNYKEKDYARALDKLIQEYGYEFMPFTSEWQGHIKEIKKAKPKDCYYMHEQVTGVICEIGKKDGDKRPHIHITGHSYKIDITQAQDEALKSFYQGAKIDFELRLKIHKATDKVISAVLKSFQLLQSGNFMHNIKNALEKEGDFFPHIKNGHEAKKEFISFD